MDPKVLLPALSTLDVVMQIASIMIHVAVGLAALAQAPRDPRTRVFAALTLLNGGGAAVPIFFWWLGISDPLAGNRLPLGFMLACLTTGTLALFHLSQVFPSRRAWIRGAGIQLPIAYVLIPAVVMLLVRFAPMKTQAGSASFALLAITFGFPLAVLVAMILPIATIVGLIRSLRDAGERGTPPDARPVIFGFLGSILLGTAVAVLALAPLEAVAPDSPATLLVSFTVWALGILMPAAFAAGVWYYRVLDIPVDGSAIVQPD